MQNSVSRRKFLQSSISGSIYLMLAPSLMANASFDQTLKDSEKGVTGGLTMISIIDNACMLSYRSGRLSLPSQQVVLTDIHLRDTPGNKGRLAGLMPAFDKRLIDLVKILKAGNEIQHAQEKRAIAFGWVAVNAAHRHINSLFEGKTADEAKQIRMHQDALVIKGFSATDAANVSASDVENLFNSMLVRTITRTHTLKPDADDGIGWVNRMADWQRKNKSYIHEFAQVVVSPDHRIAGADFIRQDDKIIEAARLLQLSYDVMPETILNEMNNQPVSAYGKALAEATGNILAIDSYLQGKLSEKEIIPKLDLL